MRYTQDSGVRRKPGEDEFKVVVSVYLTDREKDLWGAGKVRLALEVSGDAVSGPRAKAAATGRE